MKSILVFGMGKVGSLVGTLLNKRFSVKGFDKQTPAEKVSFKVITGDINDTVLLKKIIPDFDALVS